MFTFVLGVDKNEILWFAIVALCLAQEFINHEFLISHFNVFDFGFNSHKAELSVRDCVVGEVNFALKNQNLPDQILISIEISVLTWNKTFP